MDTFDELYLYSLIKINIPYKFLNNCKGEIIYKKFENLIYLQGSATLYISNIRIIINNTIINDNISIGYNCINKFEVDNNKKITIDCYQIPDRHIIDIVADTDATKRDIKKYFDIIYNKFKNCYYYRNILKKSDYLKSSIPDVFISENFLYKIEKIDYYTSKTQIQGNLNITNFRIFWESLDKEKCLSIPFIQIYKIINKNIKNNNLLVVELTKFNDNTRYAFNINNHNYNNIEKILVEYLNNNRINPCYGLKEDLFMEAYTNNSKIKRENMSLINNSGNIYNEKQNLVNFDKSKTQDNITDIIYNEELGVAMQRLPQNIKLVDIWKVIND